MKDRYDCALNDRVQIIATGEIGIVVQCYENAVKFKVATLWGAKVFNWWELRYEV